MSARAIKGDGRSDRPTQLAESEMDTGEPIRGLPYRLPADERMLWQGSPGGLMLSRRAFHVGQLAAYFGVILAWYAVTVVTDGGTALDMALDIAKPVAGAAVALGLLTLLGWLTARTAVYTITDKRIVMRFGIALPMTINLPFAQIDAASVKVGARGFGDISLALAASQKLAYALLWPHARPWRIKTPEPMLRAIPDVVGVAQILSRALAAAANLPVPAALDATTAPGTQTRPHAAAVA